MIRKTNAFPMAQSKSFNEAIIWSYLTARARPWSTSWRGLTVFGHLTRSESWANSWTTYWNGLH